ncbi:MAG TPA: hypothetical protein VJL80_14415 [Aeromicrobium sp.]|nr:hypothetical protein [Aeromicrobium sp.]HKY59227.1 hypothetical protein [Aeromicrobium sp.]
MPRKAGGANTPKIKKLTSKQIAAAKKAKPAKGRKVVKGGIVRWIFPDQ